MHRFAAAVFKSFPNLLWRLGGLGLIPLGLADNSPIPLPGSMDALTIILAAGRRDLWWYYAIMATVGAVVGGYLTYRLGAKGGKNALEKKISPKRAKKLYHIFERYGFWSVSIGALCPPPIPIVPFLLAAGAMQCPRRKFLAALALGRAVRYSALAYLGSVYSRSIFHWVGRYYKPALYTLIALAVAGGLLGLYLWRRKRKKPRSRLRKAA
jgi:membrane protein YqaA with SNARE-associated domain